MKSRGEKFESEAALVSAWLSELARFRHDKDWIIYPETAGWDLLLVSKDHGYQVGIEAKLSLNPKVLAQTLDGSHRYYRPEGPDYRGVLVPRSSCQLHMQEIAHALGVGVLAFSPADRWVSWTDSGLPSERFYSKGWPNWIPAERCRLPEYVPDVEAGKPSPVALTDWKIKAIKLCIILDRRGSVTRADMKALALNPTRWCDHWQGLLDPAPARGVYVRGKRTPDFKTMHPVNYAQIEADLATWTEAAGITI